MLTDLIALAVTLVVVAAFLGFISHLRTNYGVAPATTRKLTHAGTGMIFLLCWHLFSVNPESKYVAGVVPAFTTARFFMVGIGLIHDTRVVRSLSRPGAPDQLTHGPLAYGVVFTALTIFYWRHVVAILVAVALCLGDGAVTAPVFANIAPKQAHLRRLVSAVTFFVVSSLAGVVSIRFARATGWFAPRGELPIDDWYLSAFVALTGALIESLQRRRSHANATLAIGLLLCLRVLQFAVTAR